MSSGSFSSEGIGGRHFVENKFGDPNFTVLSPFKHKMMLKNIKPVVRQVDFALDWTTLTAGNRLYRQGEEASTVYLILSGRLRSVLEVSGSCSGCAW